MLTPLDTSVLTQLATDLGDPTFVTDTVRVYLTELPLRRDAVESAVSHGDVQALRAVCHRLGSASALLGATEVESRCRQIEWAELDVASDLEPLVASWADACDRIEPAMLDWLAVQGSNR